MRAPQAAFLAASVAVALTLTACTGQPPSETTPPSDPTPSPAPTAPMPPRPGAVEPIVSDLDAPWSIAFHGGTALLSERDSGRILEVDGDGTLRVVGVIEAATPRGEGGLLGIAVYDAHLYAYFTADDENRVERYELTGEAGSLGLGPPEIVLDGVPAASFHNGGRIAFGPDGMLYVTAGDAGNSDNAQDRGSLAGKILRLTPDGDVPGDNPFSDSPVFSYGHRNPQGLAWGDDGTLYASEFGQDTWDELNVIDPGENYGWPVVEGIADDDRFVDPVQQWAPSEASPSGMTIAANSIWIANLRGARLREVPLDDPSTSTDRIVGEHGRLRDVALAPDGSLWVLTNNTDGRGDPRPGDDRVLRIALVDR